MNNLKYTFQFQNNVYHFTNIPYVIKNSLLDFIRALHQAPGTESTDYTSLC